MEKQSRDIFLTFDMDWSIDEVLDDFYTLVKDAGVKATLNVTHQSDMLAKFRQDTDFELGIHPNFVPGFSSGGG